jgi:ribonucleoside-diphosphate reductase alpha chain
MADSKADKDVKKELSPERRNQIVNEVILRAEAMGISDREQKEEIAGRVIAGIEQARPFPGMEGLVSRPGRRPGRHPAPTPEPVRMVASTGAVPAMAPPVNEKEEPVMPATTKITAQNNLSITENARQVLEKRYLKKDKQGRTIESAEDMLHRVADTVAAADKIYNPQADTAAVAANFFGVMSRFEFLPNSPTLMNAGRELGQLSACFVLPVEDTMESIFDAVKHTALIHKSGGGTGFSFSRIRPEKDRVGSTGGVASGPVSFIRAFDTATDVIKQGGMRRGANMGILSVDHPDVMRFIMSKDNSSALTNFNISVAVTTTFMEAVKAGIEYDLINPRTREAAGKLNARDVFNKMVDMAWKTGDPGIIFIDRINQDNPTPHLGRIESTNPCGEQPLLPYESCNLGSINLARMLRQSGPHAEVDFARLAETTRIAVRFLDNVIDVNHFPLPMIEEMTKKTRKIGLGVMGWADMLVQLGLPYNSDEALQLAAKVMHFIQEEAHKTSAALAQERGVFPAFKGSAYDVPGGLKLRNATCTTIAPTGTLSIIAACSSGIEPLFALSYTRNILDGTRMIEVNPYFEGAARGGGFYSAELMEKLAGGAHLSELEGIPEKTKHTYVTAHEISPECHIKMQAAFQRFTDNAVSKTVNFAREATREDVSKVYLMAYEEKLKGITIYRDGSREAQVLSTGKTTAPAETPARTEGGVLSPRKRSKVTAGFTERVTTGCGYLYVTVNSDEQGICEVFSTLGKAGGCAAAQLEATCRLVSLALRSGIDVAKVVRQLRGIRCPSVAWEEGKSVLSCSDAIASVLERHTTGYSGKPKKEDYGAAKNLAGQCPECGTLLTYQEGCFICPGCGYTKC